MKNAGSGLWINYDLNNSYFLFLNPKDLYVWGM